MGKKEKYLIALAGLFHDIGKFYQRAKPKKDNIPAKFYSLLKKENYEQEFRYQHAAYSLIALESELKEGLSSVFSEEDLEIIKKGVYHHKPKDELEHLIQKADWVSSSERNDIKTEFFTDVLDEDIDREKFIQFATQNIRLRSVFENVDIGKKYQKKNYSYKISPLNLSKDIFPIDLEEAYIEVINGESIDKILGSYSKQWKEFVKTFNEKLKDSGLTFEKSPEKVFSLIYHIFYKYLWCIPASTYDYENYSRHYPDISLFDHSRVLSAIACCFYDFNKSVFTQGSKDEFKSELRNKKIFLHIKGDISGIQRFIYNVYEGKGGVAKTLRGRSFYVALLPEILSRYILNELEYPISNLLYSGGGIFEILVANTRENKEKLEKIKNEINQFLATEFEADLGLSLGTYEYSPVDMMESYDDVLRKLNENLDNAKKEKFEKLIDSGEIFNLLNIRARKLDEEGKNKKKCPVCQTYLIDESLTDEKEICNICDMFRNIGYHLPKTQSLIFSTDSLLKDKVHKNDKDKVITFSKFGAVYLLTDENYTDISILYKSPKTTEILDINNTSFENRYITGFKFMGKTVPRAKETLPKEETGEEEDIEKGQIVPFTVLAKHSDGDKRIGILRMDVDNLGKIFTDGLKKTKISISRIATLSRSLDLFFAGYLNKICDKLSSKYKEKNGKFDIDNFFYVLYSGGDDVFVVAPWDKGIDFAQVLQQEFEEYTCNNPNITISAGYLQTKPKFPIRVGADLAGEAEDIAKDKGKNRACVLGDVLLWSEIRDTKNVSEEWTKEIENGNLQRGFIYAVHMLKEQFLRDTQEKEKLVFPYKKKENPMFYPYIQYYIARNIKDNELKQKLAKFLLEKENFNKLTFIVNYVALKTRK